MSSRSRLSSAWGKFPLLVAAIVLLCCSLFAADQSSPALRAKAAADYLKLPLAFEANQGQAPASTLFLSRGRGYMLALEKQRALLALRPKSGEASILGFELLNPSRAASAHAEDELPGRANYLIGDESNWRTNVPLFARVRYGGVYKGIDLVYYGNQRQLEYDFRVAPGADQRQIAFRVTGADKLAIDHNGDLVISVAGREVRWHKPVAYQLSEAGNVEVSSAYRLNGNVVSLALAAFDPTRELVIDPTLAYSTYLGSTNSDEVEAIAVDGSGNAYVTGQTWGTGFPVGPGYKTTNGSNEAAFVTKLNASGSALVYSTFLGGHANQGGTAIAVDGSGYAYVGGTTSSPDFPVKNYAQRFMNGGIAFRSTNAASSWSGTNKGLQQDWTANVVVPSPTNTETIYVGGTPAWNGGFALFKSTDGGLSFSPSQTGIAGFTQVNALAFQPGSSSVMLAGTASGLYRSADAGTTWSCILCGTQTDYNFTSIAFAPGNPNLVLAGAGSQVFQSTDGGKTFPWNSFTGSSTVITGLSFADSTTAYVSVNEPTYSSVGALFKSTDGGRTYQQLQSFGFDKAAYSVLALTGSATVLVGTNNGVYRSNDGGTTWALESGSPKYVDTLASSGSTLYAGSQADGVFKSTDGGSTWLAVNSGLRNVRVRSIAISPQTSNDLYVGSDANRSDGFVTKLSQSGTSLIYSTFMGGAGVTGLAQSGGNAYVAGVTSSTNYPVTSGAFQKTNNSLASNCSYTSVGHCATGVVVKLSTTGSSFVYATYLGGNGETQPNAIAVSNGSAVVAGQTIGTDFPTKNAAQPVCAGTSCQDAFIASLSSTGSALNYSTYWGGSDFDVANGVAVDNSGNAYVVGMTSSSDYHATAGALQMTKPGQGPAAFVASFSPTGSLRYSTYYGGTGSTYYDDTGGVSQLGESGNAIAVDSAGNAVFTGSTTSPDLPVKNPVAQYVGGNCMAGHASIPCGDAFVSKLDATGSSLLFGTWLGGDGVDSGHGVALDASNNIYVGGLAGSDNFPTTAGSFDPQGHIADPYDYDQDGFVAKISLGGTTGGGGTGTCTAPTSAGVNICSPADGSTVTSPVQITAAATGVNGPVQTMKIYLDGTSVFTGSGSSLSTSLAMANGSHKITVKGWDSTSTSVSKSINITVGTTTSGGGSTGGSCTAPTSAANNTVTICSPANGSTVSSPVHVTAAAKSTSTVTSMKIYLDGTSVYSTTSSSIDTSLTMSSGSHHITVKAWVGSTSFSSAESFTVQ